ncbi:hypothetical protein [Haloarcula sp. JP-L23]|uniref:hypothetical protein n=1 Tax=Haloarcula sp. JP-L23 TaxID=2716717 RepID=UPI00140F2F34|nr:hypothetical protein G9465_02825 [Haloarcula sp. JP-L23]
MVAAVPYTSGTATAAANTETYEFNGEPYMVVINTTEMSGTVTVEWHTEGTPGSGSTVLARTDVDTTSTDGVALYAGAAYDSVNATVTGNGTATTEEYGGRLVTPDRYTVIGGTGGDADLKCDLGERIGKAVDSGFTQLDCEAQPSNGNIAYSELEAQQTKQHLYESGLNQRAAHENYFTVMDNYLQDTETQALIIGKNAYIRALNNGSSEAAARSAAHSAVNDYYSVKQTNLIVQWESSIKHYEYLQSVASSETGITQDDQSTGSTDRFVRMEQLESGGSFWAYQDYGGETNATLLNGTDVAYDSYRALWKNSDGSTYGSGQVGVNTGLVDNPESGVADEGGRLKMNATSSGSEYVYLDPVDFNTRWTNIQSQAQSVNDQLDTVVNNTYDAYTAGEIDNSDLQDPYVLQSQYNPGDEYQGWAAAQLTMLGQNSPDAMEQIGYMNVTTGSETYTGVLMSQSNPSSGQFEVNQTYDAANISGQQYIVTDSQMHELTGTFTLDAIQTHSGERRTNITIYEKQYSTANVTEMTQLYDDLAKTVAELETRQQNLGTSGGGVLFGGSSSTLLLVVVIVAGVAFYAQRDDRRRY